MKRVVLVLAVAAMFAGCAPKLIPTERKVNTYLLDFRQYAGEGFFISPNPFNGTFDPIGVITIEIYPATKIGQTSFNGMYVLQLVPEPISLSDALDMAVGEARKLGANALVDFSWSVNQKDVVGSNGKITKELSHYTFSGFAIKRKAQL